MEKLEGALRVLGPVKLISARKGCVLCVDGSAALLAWAAARAGCKGSTAKAGVLCLGLRPRALRCHRLKGRRRRSEAHRPSKARLFSWEAAGAGLG